MTLLRLMLEFFKTGLFSVGGGLATLPFLYEISDRTGWFSHADIADMIAVSESTPGAIGINMSTYAGFRTAGVPGGVLATLALLGDQNVLDELGIGTLRDAYAELLFPGISTQQTRAKYFVLVPYLFQSAMEQVKKGRIGNSQVLLQWIHDEEHALISTLINNTSPDETGIIGINNYRQKRAVKTKPSTIYWSGLRRFGILRADVPSTAAACKVILANAERGADAELLAREESFDDPTALHSGSALFSAIRPDYPYQREASILLTHGEAEFLRTCVLRSVPGSMLAFFLREGVVSDDFFSVPEERLEEDLRRHYVLAKGFSRFIYGAHLRYNVIFSDYTDADMADQFARWRDDILSDPVHLEEILVHVNCEPILSSFCMHFLDAVQKNDMERADNLIIARERTTKGARAKLCKPTEYRYDPGRPVHAYQLSFRYERAAVIARDILNGLEADADV